LLGRCAHAVRDVLHPTALSAARTAAARAARGRRIDPVPDRRLGGAARVPAPGQRRRGVDHARPCAAQRRRDRAVLRRTRVDDDAAAATAAPHARERADAVRGTAAAVGGFHHPFPRNTGGLARSRPAHRVRGVERRGGRVRAARLRAIPVELQALQAAPGKRIAGHLSRTPHDGGYGLMRWYVALTWTALRLLGVLPLRALYAMGTALGIALWWRRHARERVHTEVSLTLACPKLTGASRARLTKLCLVETGRAVTELAAVWGRGALRALELVREVRGQELFEAALGAKRGLIIAAPHLGCWEVLNHWLSSRTPIAILYAPPRDPAFEAMLRRARGGLAPQQVRADAAGVRSLYKRLTAGGVVGILPDQQPKRGEGQFAPFFGAEANTMVLLPRMAHRT